MMKPSPSQAEAPRHPQHLWNQRATGFFQEIKPYLGYALQSISLTVILIMLAGSIGYHQLLTGAPPDFPFRLLAACMLFPALWLSPIRTYIKEADLIFLVPMEADMAAYMKKAAGRAMVMQTLLLLAVWMAVWPMYAISAGKTLIGFLHVLVMLAAAKRVMLHARALELKLTEKRTIRWFGWMRAVFAAGTVYALIVLPVWQGTLAAALGLLVYLACMRPARKESLNWPRLVELEKRHRRTVLRLLNYFIDVPSVQGAPRSTQAPKQVLRWLGGFKHEAAHTYRFLYTLVWLRSEWCGISLRLTLLGMILLAVCRGALLTSGVFAVFAGLTLIQLKELQKAYRHSDWSFVYPLAPELRPRSARTVVFRIHAFCLVLLTVPALGSMPSPAYAGGWFIVSIGLSYLHSIQRVKTKGSR